MKFYKLHGAGNDFIFFTGNKAFPRDIMTRLCDRNLGIGADGVIIIGKSRGEYDFTMRYFNSDGSAAGFCANGGRCAVRLASELNYFEGFRCEFKAGDGVHTAEILKDGRIKLQMKMPERYAEGIKFKGIEGEFYFLNTGVEHVVGYVKDIRKVEVEKLGPIIRNDRIFSGGTNVDFVQKTGDSTLNIRTYERGVEAETKACGTGITAAGWLDMTLSGDQKDRNITTSGNSELTVSVIKNELFLTGPAELVFEGKIDI